MAPASASAETLLVLGDSLSAAYGLKSDQGWVSLLEQRLKQQSDFAHIKVVNASISGETTTGGLNRLPDLLKRYQPKWVIVELGANDGLRGTSIKVIKRNLAQMVSLSQDANAEVLLLGMHIPPNYGPRYTKMFFDTFAEIAAEKNTLYLPFLLDGVGGEDRYMQRDGLHPNVEGQKIMVENVWNLIGQLLS